jgi:hypothetical protein
MAKAIPNPDRRKLYTIRSSYYAQANHSNDYLTNLGYDYRGNMLKNTTSPELWANPIQTSMYGRLEGMLAFVLEQVKIIKKTFSIAHTKDNININ